MQKAFLIRFVVFASLLLASWSAFATHNRAGEITYEHISGLTYRIKITTYTKASAVADRPWLKIRWGDEPSNVTEDQLDSLSREDPPTDLLGLDTQVNIYYGNHTYASTGTFVIAVEDPNRNAGILNINNGDSNTEEGDKTSTSVMAVFAITTTLVIRPGFNGHNDSVILTKPPTDIACINTVWEHNPGAYDPNGDQLVYSLVNCLGAAFLPLEGWESPELFTDDTSDSFIINSETGDITWDVPLVAGEYNIAILIQEFRDGDLVGSVLRDMQITVVNCNNDPPIISPLLPDYCVDAGSSLTIPLTVFDPNSNSVVVTPYSGIFTELVHDATWNNSSNTLNWNPECEEVRNEPYYVSFSATDNGLPNAGIPSLTDIETVSIRVVAPRVENPAAVAQGNQVTLTWDPTPCLNAFPSYQLPFVSYDVYRRQGSFGFIPDQCETGVPAYTGYTYIGSVDGATTTTYIDTDVIFGGEFCYMIVTIWPDGAESYASTETCVIIRKDAPVMTKVSIEITDVATGKDTIQWSAPDDIDLEIYLPPYKYQLYYNSGFNYPDQLLFTSPDFNTLAEGPTEFFHENINTVDGAHNYRVEFYSQGQKVNSSAEASSVFLDPVPGDNQVLLQMTHETPWDNYEYKIYRKAPGETDFSLYATVQNDTYTDVNLVNNQLYCYRVLAYGTYNAPGVPAVLPNWSQEVCTRPYDQTAPCAPELDADGDCSAQSVDLLWTNPNLICADDVMAYNIYYAPIEGQPLVLIATVDEAENITYLYKDEILPLSIAGCYAVTALDSLNIWPDGELHQNESELSNIVCVDNCPIYFLPNIFSPNGDGINDLFVPFEYRYIESVDFKVFNRWGNLVFETTDPAILWDGKNKDSGNMSSDGVYFYTIEVNTIRLSGIVTEKFSGLIQMVDSGSNNTGGQ
jgi:gliding motility-associated-like protein